jgi:hypothetical protein
MFSFSIFFAFCFTFLSPQQQKADFDEVYQVVFVQGKILNQSKNQMLARGTKVSVRDKVVFKSKDAKAVVISSTRGRFILDSKKAKGNGSELIAFVNEVVSPLKTNSKLSTRAGANEKGITNLGNHFGTDKNYVTTFAILGDSYNFKYIPKDDRTVTFTIHYNGEKSRTLKVKFNQGIYEFNKENYFKQNLDKVKRIDVYEAIFSKESKIPNMGEIKATFKPLFLDKQELAGAFKDYLAAIDLDEAVKSYLKGTEEENKAKFANMKESDKKREILYYFIQEAHGQVDAEGNLDVNKIKVDEVELDKFIKENNL